MQKLLEHYFHNTVSATETITQIEELTRRDNPQWRENALRLVIILKQTKRKLSLSSDVTPVNEHYEILITMLKEKFQKSPDMSWKDGLFNQQTSSRLNLHNIGIVSNFHISQPATKREFSLHDDQYSGLSSVLGITFSSNLNENQVTRKLCLDAEYTSGSGGTTADGIGEYSCEELNSAIAASSSITAKYLTRLVNGYNSSAELLTNLPRLFEYVKLIVKAHFYRHPIEGACCVVTKAFLEKDRTISVVTGAIGDCMALAWDKTSRSITILASARHHDFGLQFNPVSITDNLFSTAIQTSIHRFKNPVIIIRMTDGAWQMLPHCPSKLKMDRKTRRKYLEPSIDLTAWKALFLKFDKENPHATAEHYRDFLLSIIIDNINRTKEQLPSTILKLTKFYIPKFLEGSKKQLEDILFKDFYFWLRKFDTEFFTQFTRILLEKEYVMDQKFIKSIKLVEIVGSLEETSEIGDDVTLSVQDSQCIFDLNSFGL